MALDGVVTLVFFGDRQQKWSGDFSALFNFRTFYMIEVTYILGSIVNYISSSRMQLYYANVLVFVFIQTIYPSYFPSLHEPETRGQITIFSDLQHI